MKSDDLTEELFIKNYKMLNSTDVDFKKLKSDDLKEELFIKNYKMLNSTDFVFKN